MITNIKLLEIQKYIFYQVSRCEAGAALYTMCDQVGSSEVMRGLHVSVCTMTATIVDHVTLSLVLTSYLLLSCLYVKSPLLTD